VPPRQVWPVAQAWPQLPQLALSIVTSTQLVPHKLLPPAQTHFMLAQSTMVSEVEHAL
jgi:hypothetical protein